MINKDKVMVFKKCPKCGFEWMSRDHFLRDSSIKIIGYQNNLEEFTEGIFLFNHSCKTTLAVLSNSFIDLYNDLIPENHFTSEPKGALECLYASDLAPCIGHGDSSFISELIQIIKRYPRTES